MPYVIKFGDLGYYAEKQEYYWQFTNDIMKAKIYKTLEYATERKEEAKDHPKYSDGGLSIIEVEEVWTIKEKKVVSCEYASDIKKEREELEKKMKDSQDLIERWQQKKSIK